jgi:type IV pilus assembly protein PilV
MLEALITIVILAFGILGLAGLQSRMQQAEVESYQRSQALVLLEDIAARISANRVAASAYDTSALAKPLGVGDSQPATCISLSAGKDRDWCEWSNALKGSSEKVGTSNSGAMAGARGCIEPIAGSNPASYRLLIAWQGLVPTHAPNFDCAQGFSTTFGADTGLRRTITKVISIANLTPP